MIDQNIKACQSALVDMLLKSETEGFSWDDVENVYADPSDWTTETIYEFADDNGIELDDDPRKMTRGELLEEVYGDEDHQTEETDDELRETIEADKEDSWKDQIRDWSNDNPQEVYQWFLVDSWLCGQLRDMGEVVIDNDYGYWWGRGCCGQAIALDSTFYRLAESLGYFDDIKE